MQRTPRGNSSLRGPGTCDSANHAGDYAELSEGGSEKEVEATAKSWIMKGRIHEIKEFGFYPDRYVKDGDQITPQEKQQQKRTWEAVLFADVQASVGSDRLGSFCSSEADLAGGVIHSHANVPKLGLAGLGLKRAAGCSRSQEETASLFSPSPSWRLQIRWQLWGAFCFLLHKTEKSH